MEYVRCYPEQYWNSFKQPTYSWFALVLKSLTQVYNERISLCVSRPLNRAELWELILWNHATEVLWTWISEVVQPSTLAARVNICSIEERRSSGAAGEATVGGGRLTARIFHISVNKYLHSPNDHLLIRTAHIEKQCGEGMHPWGIYSVWNPFLLSYLILSIFPSLFHHTRFPDGIFVSLLSLRRGIAELPCYQQ
jgi:hypothetical protein